MAKKKQNRNFEPSINFRLPKELKDVIEKEAQDKNITTSRYLRDLLEEIHSGEYCYKVEVKKKIDSFLYSKEFLQLMVWIYRKKENNKLEVEKGELSKYIKTLKKLDNYFPENIAKEFDKVLNDVLELKADNSYANRTTFEFYRGIYEYKTFNLKLVEDYLLDDARQQQFLNIKSVFNMETPDLSGYTHPDKEQNIL